MTVELIDSMGGDHSIIRAARVSSGTAGDDKKDCGLLNMLMRDRHGSPFEAVTIQFKIECPIFVAREFFRHRIASYNEVSGRYKVLESVFYVPSAERPLRQVGKPGAYTFEQGDYKQMQATHAEHMRMATEAWGSYEHLLKHDVAREVARNVLPLSLYTSFYVTMNARSLMNFLSLRATHENTTVPTFPLHEIEMVAHQMEDEFKKVCPITQELFNHHGRVCP
ncbi:FAD-dependent thymidylate synthase [Streptomyces yunnanensis]|uniref:Flavin-dependent thymidylate synthase n=1 Tax=Streptomyces yunnanensis TaxID=156453 RepID=A0ABY8AKQ7_9ACTN|nr:FAD-dependent thymidylate synthase [Streptomyces yunnanensis]WEB45568.1 FAD-dependent thymidylate synthase [Streptomyces yunnanensis]